MGDHHGRQPIGDQPPVRAEVSLHVRPFAPVDRQGDVGIRGDRPMPGEMLGRRRHAGIAHAEHVGHGELADRAGIRVQRTIADHAADAIIEVDAGRERHVDAHRTQFRGHQPSELAREAKARGTVRRVATADLAQRRQSREPVAKPLHAPAFLVDRHQQRRRPDRVNLRDQARKLRRAFVVAREQDHAADLRVREHVALLGLERDAAEVDHHGTERHARGSKSAMDST